MIFREMITINAAVEIPIVAINVIKKKRSRRQASRFHVISSSFSSCLVTSSTLPGCFSMDSSGDGAILDCFCPVFLLCLQKHASKQKANDSKADGISLSSEVWYTLMTIMTKSTAMVATAKVDAR